MVLQQNKLKEGLLTAYLKPVAIYPDPVRKNGFLVMTEVLNADGSAHESNARATINDDDNDFWFGFEQEYFIMDTQTQLPLGFPVGGYPGPQGMYYCSVGGKNTHGRDFVEEHADLCIDAGLNFEGINQEVASGQWEFQLFAKGAKIAGDEIWIARYLLDRLTEQYGYYIEYHPKPIKGDWNGSGMHANFSNTTLRTCGDENVYNTICEAFRPVTKEHIAVYGEFNDQRLTGLTRNCIDYRLQLRSFGSWSFYSYSNYYSRTRMERMVRRQKTCFKRRSL